MFSLAGKTALITGASGGIGAAIAKAEEGEPVHILPCNLSKPEEVEKLIPSAEAALGSLDILINNAGITKDGLAMRMKDEDWQSVIDVNLTSNFRLSRAAMRSMMKKRWGRIINITSIVGVTGNPGQVNYVASKAGLIG